MTVHAQLPFTKWYSEGNLASYVRSTESPGGFLNMLEAVQPSCDVSRPASAYFSLYQDLRCSSRVRGDLGGGSFGEESVRGGFFVAAPDFANTVPIDKEHSFRSLSFPVAQWQDLLNNASDGQSSLEFPKLHAWQFCTPAIQSALPTLGALCKKEGAPSRLLACEAACKILAELRRMGRAPFTLSKGGLDPWSERRCLELVRAWLSEDISLDELAAEAQFSPYNFAGMFKRSLGMPPRFHLTRLRVEKAVGYPSNHVLARVFTTRLRIKPSDYRRAVRDPVRPFISRRARAALEGPQ